MEEAGPQNAKSDAHVGHSISPYNFHVQNWSLQVNHISQFLEPPSFSLSVVWNTAQPVLEKTAQSIDVICSVFACF